MSLGLKLKKTARTIGRKLKKGEQLGRKALKQVDIGARKVGNTSEKIVSALDIASGLTSGTPLEGAITVAKDIAKGVGVTSGEVRRGAQALEKKSRREIAEDLVKGGAKLSKFV